jgi:hypothetical protein
MIRGAIEVAQKTRVVGWIYSAAEPLRGKTVLAFVGGRCVGSGEVDGFRRDLLDAKLGDGFCGFDFPVRLAENEAVGALIVRLQFSDVALLQQTSRVVGGGDMARAMPNTGLGAMQPGRVAWMMDRGMLAPPEYDFLNALQSIGAYARSLRVAKPGSGEAAGQRMAPEAVAEELLGLVMMAETRVLRASVAAVADIAAPTQAAAPVLALWSQQRGRISVDERSHHAGGRGTPQVLAEPPPGGIDYDYGPDRLLFVHRDCRFAARGPAPASGIVVFTCSAVERAAARTARAA